MRRAVVAVFAGAVLGVCLGWLAILLAAPETDVDTALGLILVTGAVGGAGGFFAVGRGGKTIG